MYFQLDDFGEQEIAQKRGGGSRASSLALFEEELLGFGNGPNVVEKTRAGSNTAVSRASVDNLFGDDQANPKDQNLMEDGYGRAEELDAIFNVGEDLIGGAATPLAPGTCLLLS